MLFLLFQPMIYYFLSALFFFFFQRQFKSVSSSSKPAVCNACHLLPIESKHVPSSAKPSSSATTTAPTKSTAPSSTQMKLDINVSRTYLWVGWVFCLCRVCLFVFVTFRWSSQGRAFLACCFDRMRLTTRSELTWIGSTTIKVTG